MAPMRASGNGRIVLAVSICAGLTTAVPAQENRPESPKSPVPSPMTRPMALVAPEAVIAIGGERRLAIAGEAVWITTQSAPAVSRIDPKSGKVDKTVALAEAPCGGMVGAFGSLWIPLCSHGLARVDLKTHTVTTTIPTPLAKTTSLATAAGSVWAFTDDRGTLTRFDPDTNNAVAEVYTPAGTSVVVAGGDALWATSPTGDRLTRINPHTNLIVETITVGAGPRSIVVAEGAVWTLNVRAGTVSRVDIKTNKVVETIALGGSTADGAIAAGAGSIWISRPGTPLARIDPRTDRLMQVFTGDGGGLLAFGHGALWLAPNAAAVWRVDPGRVEASR